MKDYSSLRVFWLAKRKTRLTIVGLLTLVLIAVSACAFLRIHGMRDIEAYRGMATECPPVWKAFALRRFVPGDSARELFRRFPPARRLEFGPYGIYSFSKGSSNDFLFFTSFSVVTRDGKLICAGADSCTWQFTFFSTKDPELDRQYAAFQEQSRHKLEEARLEKMTADLVKFHILHDRWPTNEMEIYWFVTGEKPPSEPATSAEKQFRKRYGLDSPPANLLGVTLKACDNGTITIASVRESNLVRIVAKPRK